MNSLISYPNRGHYGKSNYRGNCSGHVIKDLVQHFSPKLFVDTCEGSGTSGDVCRELGVQYVGLDLHRGFDFLSNPIINELPRQADMVFSHPPYHDMINYEQERQKHGLGVVSSSDTSICLSPEEFIEKSQLMLLNQREATRRGGVYTTLIGDYRKAGKFHSFQSDFIQLMPKDELMSVTIKAQHNVMSNGRSYSGSFVPIMHEYLLIWKKKEKTMYQVMMNKAYELKRNIQSTWRNLIRIALMNLGGEAPLKSIYNEVAKLAATKVSLNANYQAKIRQQLQFHFTNVERGVWAV